MLFRMVPKHVILDSVPVTSFRAVLFRMVPKHFMVENKLFASFRAVLFRMVPKLRDTGEGGYYGF